MLRQKASRKQELSQQIDEKVARKDYAGAAALQERLKEDAMPPRSEGDDDSAHAQAARKLELQQQLDEKLAQKDYAGAKMYKSVRSQAWPSQL